MVEKTPFGTLPDGRGVHTLTLKHPSGASAQVLEYGGILRGWQVPDFRGSFTDIVLGFNTLEHYLENWRDCFGACVGRVAGRTTAGRFVLDGQNYQLDINQPPNHIHGGNTGWHRRLWDIAESGDDADGNPFVTLAYHSPSGEEGYPGNLDIRIRYTLEATGLRLDYEAHTDAPTPLSPTSHGYFNLDGESSCDLSHHCVQIHSDHYTPTDEQFTFTGTRAPVAGTPADLRSPRALKDVFPDTLMENYLLHPAPAGQATHAATVYSTRSGLQLDAYTTQPCLMLYLGKYITATQPNKSGTPLRPHAGFCLECQGFPDGANHPEIVDIILRPDQRFKYHTFYKLSRHQP